MNDMAEDRVQISVTIADRRYQYIVNPDDEKYLRDSVRRIADTLSELKTKYSFNDNQDALANALLQYVTRLVKMKYDDESGAIIREIEFLDNQLDEYIKTNVE